MINFDSTFNTSFQILMLDRSIFLYSDVFWKSGYKYLQCEEVILHFVTSVATVRFRYASMLQFIVLRCISSVFQLKISRQLDQFI